MTKHTTPPSGNNRQAGAKIQIAEAAEEPLIERVSTGDLGYLKPGNVIFINGVSVRIGNIVTD